MAPLRMLYSAGRIDWRGEMVHTILEMIRELPVWLGVGLLGLSACIEYLFPPFPGDAVVLAGASLIALAGWPVWGVFGALMAGTGLGAWGSWRLGVWLRQTRGADGRLHRWMERPDVAARVVRLCERFERHGALYLVLNRFLPAFRSLFFVAAGYAGMGRGPVVGAALLGGALWNGVLLGAGWAVGYNLEALVGLSHAYGRVIWAVLAVIGLVWCARWLVMRWRGGEGK